VRAAGRLLSTLLAATAGLGVTVTAVLLPAASAVAAEPCVGVIVDARLLGSSVTTGCAEGDPDTGLEALISAGFRYAFVTRQPGLVCQVDSTPDCSRTSTSTYWSYWYREKGSSTWVYSSGGAGSRDPAPGSTEAWVWQDGGRREPPDVSFGLICPQAADTATTKPSPDPSPSPVRPSENVSPPASATGPPATARATSETPRTTTPAPAPSSASATPVPPSETATAPPTVTSQPATEAPSTSPAATGTSDRESDPPWAGLAVGGGLVAAIGAAAFARGRRAGGSR